MAKNKTISLDDHTAEIADRMPNFSRFVRQCLIKFARDASMGRDAAHVAPPEARIWGETKDKCNPMHHKGRCPMCWGME